MAEKSQPSERVNKEPNPAQLAAAHVSIMLQTLHLLNGVAKEHTGKRIGREYRFVKNALTDLFFIRGHNLPIEPFRERLGNRAEEIESLLDETSPQLSDISSKTFTKASDLSARNRATIAIHAVRKLKSLPDEQRRNLLEMAGYTKDELISITKKLGVSAGLSAVTGVTSSLLVGGAVAYEKTDPLISLGNITDGKTLAAVLLSYAAQYSSMYLVGRTNNSLLGEPTINTCPSIWATSAYFLLNKFFPDSEKASRRGGMVGTYSPILIQEPFLIPSLALPFVGPQVVFARNMAGTAFQLVESGMNAGWLSVKRKK